MAKCKTFTFSKYVGTNQSTPRGYSSSQSNYYGSYNTSYASGTNATHGSSSVGNDLFDNNSMIAHITDFYWSGSKLVLAVAVQGDPVPTNRDTWTHFFIRGTSVSSEGERTCFYRRDANYFIDFAGHANGTINYHVWTWTINSTPFDGIPNSQLFQHVDFYDEHMPLTTVLPESDRMRLEYRYQDYAQYGSYPSYPSGDDQWSPNKIARVHIGDVEDPNACIVPQIGVDSINNVREAQVYLDMGTNCRAFYKMRIPMESIGNVSGYYLVIFDDEDVEDFFDIGADYYVDRLGPTGPRLTVANYNGGATYISSFNPSIDETRVYFSVDGDAEMIVEGDFIMREFMPDDGDSGINDTYFDVQVNFDDTYDDAMIDFKHTSAGSNYLGLSRNDWYLEDVIRVLPDKPGPFSCDFVIRTTNFRTPTVSNSRYHLAQTFRYQLQGVQGPRQFVYQQTNHQNEDETIVTEVNMLPVEDFINWEPSRHKGTAPYNNELTLANCTVTYKDSASGSKNGRRIIRPIKGNERFQATLEHTYGGYKKTFIVKGFVHDTGFTNGRKICHYGYLAPTYTDESGNVDYDAPWVRATSSANPVYVSHTMPSVDLVGRDTLAVGMVLSSDHNKQESLDKDLTNSTHSNVRRFIGGGGTFEVSNLTGGTLPYKDFLFLPMPRKSLTGNTYYLANPATSPIYFIPDGSATWSFDLKLKMGRDSHSNKKYFEAKYSGTYTNEAGIEVLSPEGGTRVSTLDTPIQVIKVVEGFQTGSSDVFIPLEGVEFNAANTAKYYAVQTQPVSEWSVGSLVEETVDGTPTAGFNLEHWSHGYGTYFNPYLGEYQSSEYQVIIYKIG